MKSAHIAILVTTTLISCDRNGRGVPPRDSMQSSSGGNATSGGDITDLRPRVVILSPSRGASNVDAQVRIVMSVFCPAASACAADARSALPLIASRVKLIRSPGDTIDVVPETIPPPTASAKGGKVDVVLTNEVNAALVPSNALVGDASYQLESRSDSEVLFAFPDASAEEAVRSLSSTNALPTRFQIPVFTGSAPTVTRLEVVTSPGKAITSLRLRFSEPVRLGGLVKGLQLRAANGDVQPGCPRSPVSQACADDQNAEASEGIDFLFSAPIEFKTLQTATVQLSGAVNGSGRTVAEGAIVRGRTLIPVGSDRALVATIGASSWTPCSSNGDVQCVRYLDL